MKPGVAHSGVDRVDQVDPMDGTESIPAAHLKSIVIASARTWAPQADSQTKKPSSLRGASPQATRQSTSRHQDDAKPDESA